VLNFHPIHVFANTTSPEHYARFKPHYRAPTALRELKADGPGTASIFCSVLERVQGSPTRTLSEVHDDAVA
jgi:hypothetical protein